MQYSWLSVEQPIRLRPSVVYASLGISDTIEDNSYVNMPYYPMTLPIIPNNGILRNEQTSGSKGWELKFLKEQSLQLWPDLENKFYLEPCYFVVMMTELIYKPWVGQMLRVILWMILVINSVIHSNYSKKAILKSHLRIWLHIK